MKKHRFCMLNIVSVIVLLVSSFAWADSYHEAPGLKKLVEEGKLPPVAERLPEEPMLYEAPEVGIYGGTLRIGHVVQNRSIDGMAIIAGFRGERFIELSMEDYITPLPGIAAKWEYSADGKMLTLWLRKGLKWSDGQALTTEDVRFWWEDFMLNEEISPNIRTYWKPGGELMTLEILDEYTFKLHFAAPNLSLITRWSGEEGPQPLLPAHYLKQFHPKYTPMEQIEKLMKQEDDETWVSLFNRMNTAWPVYATNLNPDRPVLTSHVFVKQVENMSIFERNPYYWKVDNVGNQLPYIDRVEDTFMNNEVLNMKVISGELDFVGDPANFADYTLYKENEEAGGYKVLRWKLCWATDISFMPNQNHKDPVLAAINQDKRFRHALSYSVNREKINEIVYHGLGTPSQHAVQTPGNLYDEKYRTAHIEYDIEKANAFLDEMGLEWDKDHKFRLRSDGKTLTYVIPIVSELGAKMSGIVEIQREEWEKIGIKVEIKEMSLQLFGQVILNQEIDMGLWLGYPGTEVMFYAWPRDYVPIQVTWSEWGSEWARWHSTGGEQGIEPPDEIKAIQKAYDDMLAASGEEEKIANAKKILDSQAENLWCIGTVAQTPQPIIIHKDLKNVVESTYWTWEAGYAKVANPSTWFYAR